MAHRDWRHAVVPLTYAVQGSQSGMLLRHYKDDPVREARTHHSRIIDRLLYLGIMLHENCIGNRLARPITPRLAIPSLKDRPGPHPFSAIARRLRAVNESSVLTPKVDSHHRGISARHFALKPAIDLTGQHVLLLDDTWTTGASAHSAALALRAAGAETVSVMVIGRWLVPRYQHNTEFIAGRLSHDYDPRRCPVTGGDCP